MSDKGHLPEGVRNKEFPAVAAFLSQLEALGASAVKQFPELFTAPAHAFRFGITGPPGAGKSTLISLLIRSIRARGQTVAVLAVDPSSPFSKGAVLGDRIRYLEHFTDPGVFIRSLGSRGSLGGLSASTYLMVRAFDVAKFDVVLIETVGVGQTELEVMYVADKTAVVLVPESGDAIQGMKAGLLEIADLFVVNKADRPGSDVFINELESALDLDPRAKSVRPPIIATRALEPKGTAALEDFLKVSQAAPQWRSDRVAPKRLRAEGRALLRAQIETEILSRADAVKTTSDLQKLFEGSL